MMAPTILTHWSHLDCKNGSLNFPDLMMEYLTIISGFFSNKHFLTSAIVSYRFHGTTIQMLYVS